MIPIVPQVAVIPGTVASPTAGPASPVLLTRRACPASATDGEVVVCGRKDQPEFRLGPEPSPPPADNLLTRPLRWQIAPGVSLGFQRGGGFGVSAEFGLGKKSGEP